MVNKEAFHLEFYEKEIGKKTKETLNVGRLKFKSRNQLHIGHATNEEEQQQILRQNYAIFHLTYLSTS